MQNALIIGPITVSVTEAGFAQTGHYGHAFADSFCEDVVQPSQTDRETDSFPAAAGTSVWNDSLLSTTLRDCAPTEADEFRDASLADPVALAPGLMGVPLSVEARTRSDAGNAGHDAGTSDRGSGPSGIQAAGGSASGPVLLQPAAGFEATDDSPIPLDDRSAVLSLPDGHGHALPQAATWVAQSPPVPTADGLQPATAPVEIASADEAADADPFRPSIVGDRSRIAGPVAGPVFLPRARPEVFDQIHPITTGPYDEDPAAKLLTSPTAMVEVARHQSGAGASDQTPDPRGEDVHGLAAAQGISRSRPERIPPPLPSGLGTGLSTDAGTAPAEPAGPVQPDRRVAGSFWERVFHDATQAQADDAPHLAAERSTINWARPAGIPADGAAIPSAVAVSPLRAADRDQTSVSIEPAQADPARSPDPIGSTGPAMPPSGVSGADLLARLVVEAWPDPSFHALAETEVIPASGDCAPVPGPAAQNTTHGPPLTLAVPQMAAQFVAVLRRNAGGAAELSLAPAELGRVRLRIEPDARDPDRLLILINVERPETLELFRRHATELADAIRSAGYSGSSIDFGQQGRGNQHEAGPDERGSLTAAESRDTEQGQIPFRNVTGETLDIRL